jgi:hypothetical protein
MCRLLFDLLLVPRYPRSLVRSSAPGFLSVSSHPSMVIWVQTKKVCGYCTYDWILSTATLPGCGGLQEQIPYQGLDPQCTSSNLFCHNRDVAFTHFS